jgi:hypothetical protein
MLLFTGYFYPMIILQQVVFFKGVIIVTFDTNFRLPPLLSEKFSFYGNFLTRLFTCYSYPTVMLQLCIIFQSNFPKVVFRGVSIVTFNSNSTNFTNKIILYSSPILLGKQKIQEHTRAFFCSDFTKKILHFRHLFYSGKYYYHIFLDFLATSQNT